MIVFHTAYILRRYVKEPGWSAVGFVGGAAQPTCQPPSTVIDWPVT